MTSLLAVASLWKCEHVNTQASISCHGHMPTRAAPDRMLRFTYNAQYRTLNWLCRFRLHHGLPFLYSSYPWILTLISQATTPITSDHELLGAASGHELRDALALLHTI